MFSMPKICQWYLSFLTDIDGKQFFEELFVNLYLNSEHEDQVAGGKSQLSVEQDETGGLGGVSVQTTQDTDQRQALSDQ